MLTPLEAEHELQAAAQMSPGPWVGHSRAVGENARLIAARVEGMNPDWAYAMGLLHDIGRREGFKGILHLFDGYEYMLRLQQPEIARICLTHSYPVQDARVYFGQVDCTDEQMAFLTDFLRTIQYDEYDRLIQLCDSLSLPDGACIMEKRLVDVCLRHGLHDFTLDKWRADLRLKRHFDELCGCNLYALLPRVMENSYLSLL